MATRCAFCAVPIEDRDPRVEVPPGNRPGSPSVAHPACAQEANRPFRETVSLADRPDTEQPKPPAGKELRG